MNYFYYYYYHHYLTFTSIVNLIESIGETMHIANEDVQSQHVVTVNRMANEDEQSQHAGPPTIPSAIPGNRRFRATIELWPLVPLHRIS